MIASSCVEYRSSPSVLSFTQRLLLCTCVGWFLVPICTLYAFDCRRMQFGPVIDSQNHQRSVYVKMHWKSSGGFSNTVIRWCSVPNSVPYTTRATSDAYAPNFTAHCLAIDYSLLFFVVRVVGRIIQGTLGSHPRDLWALCNPALHGQSRRGSRKTPADASVPDSKEKAPRGRRGDDYVFDATPRMPYAFELGVCFFL